MYAFLIANANQTYESLARLTDWQIRDLCKEFEKK